MSGNNFLKLKNSWGDSLIPTFGLDWGDNSFKERRTNYRYNHYKSSSAARNWENIQKQNTVMKNKKREEAYKKREKELKNKEVQKEKDMILFRVSVLQEEYRDFSNDFYNSQTNPETLLIKPLIRDVTVSATRSMINSYNRLRDAMDTLNIEEEIDKLEFLLNRAKVDFDKAEKHAREIGIPGTDYATKRRAMNSFKIVLDDAATKEEKLSHWNNILKIVRQSGIKEEVITSINSHTVGMIENGRVGALREIV